MEGIQVDTHKVYLNFVDKHCLGKTHIKTFDEWIGKRISATL